MEGFPPTTLPFKFNPWIQRMQARSWKVMKVMSRKGNLMILAMTSTRGSN